MIYRTTALGLVLIVLGILTSVWAFVRMINDKGFSSTFILYGVGLAIYAYGMKIVIGGSTWW